MRKYFDYFRTRGSLPHSIGEQGGRFCTPELPAPRNISPPGPFTTCREETLLRRAGNDLLEFRTGNVAFKTDE